MAIAFRSSSTATGQGVSSVNIVLPSDIIANDYILIVSESTAGPGYSTSTGYTNLAGNGTATTYSHITQRKIAVAGDAGATVAVSLVDASSGRQSVVALVYSGVDTTTPEDVTTTSADNAVASTSITCPTNISVTDNCMHVLCGAQADASDASDPATATAPTGYSAIRGVRTTAAGGVDSGVYSCDKLITPAGATGAQSITGDVSAQGHGTSVLLRPAAAGTKAPPTLPPTRRYRHNLVR